jgi:cytochrome oxidase assembly protein ShyY1
MSRRRRFHPGWRMTLFALLLLPVVLGLGFWQLERAAEKRSYEADYLDRLTALPVAPEGALLDFQRVRLHGQFEPGRDFLLDNQTSQGRVGYRVISSFQTGDGRRWLVNRGFLAGTGARERLPEISTPVEPLTLVGVVWPDLGLLPIFAADAWSAGWPKRIQRLEVARMARELDNTQPWEIRLEAGQPGVFEPASLEMNMPAVKHTGYAVQWFGLALALALGYLLFGFRNEESARTPGAR